MIKNKIFLQNYNQLSKFNVNNIDFKDINILQEIENYLDNLKNWNIYHWNTEIIEKDKYIYPNIHNNIKKIISICERLNLKNILDVGAGNGKITKYLFQRLNNELEQKCKFNCLEGKNEHINEMKRNFKKNSERITSPNIDVVSNFYNGYSQNMEFEDSKFDMVFTCTVLMHQPFLPALLSICEIARVSKKYVLHLENKNSNGAVTCMPLKNNMTENNKVGIDFKSIYEYLGFKTLINMELTDPNVDNVTYVLYLGQKV
jgi:ubiquinone/menaquinone biosynthesis C-methylase UbiE